MKRATALCLVSILLAGCAGTETGNPSVAPITMGLRTTDPDIATPGPGSGVGIEEAWLAAASLRTIEGAACDAVARPPAVVDAEGELVVGVATEGLPAGSFCGVHVELQASDALPPGAPEASRGRALFVRGASADGVAFEIALDGPTTLELRTPGGALAVADGDAFVLTFDVARWLSTGAIEAVTPDVDGVRRIEAGDTELGAFEAGLVSSGELYSDLDADGVLDVAEVAAGALAASH